MSDILPEGENDAPALVPVQEEPLALPDALAAYEESLQTPISPDDLVVTETPPPPVGRSWAFDFTTNRFVTSPSAHGPLATSGLATLRLLIEKALRTARGAHPIYDDSYGIDLPADFIGGPVSKFPSDLYASRVREAAISAHERVVDVIDFQTQVDPTEDYVAVSFTVILDNADTLTISNVPLGVS